MKNLLGLIFDGGLAVLLIVTIVYCARLSRRIRQLQDSRGELGGMIAHFDQATARAMTTLAELQTTAKRITEALQLKIEKANFLADDLAFLIEKSTKLAAQLDAQAKTLRPEAAKPKPSTDAPPTAPLKPKLASWQPGQGQAAHATDISSTIKSTASLEALLARLAQSPPASGNAAPAAPKQPQAPKPERSQSPRTGAERELLEALKSGR